MAVDMDLGDTRLILEYCRQRDVLRNQAAYILATVKWETAHTMRPITEQGSDAYLKGQKYWPYIGRGYVQITWRDNYQKASEETGVDLVADPDRTLEPEIAAEILVCGMMEGWFTAYKLPDFVTLQRSDFIGARKVVNGTDRKHEIAAIAREYDAALKAEGYGEEDPAPVIAPVRTPPSRPTPTRTKEPAMLGATGLATRIILYAIGGHLVLSGVTVDPEAGTITLRVEELMNVVLGGGGIAGALGWRKIAKMFGGKL